MPTEPSAVIAIPCAGLAWRRFDAAGLPRIAQLVGRSNQFNLTARRYSAAELAALAEAPGVLALQFRLQDRFGDNGMVAVLIGREEGDALAIECWLMSCRVLGRQVEQACLAVLAEQ